MIGTPLQDWRTFSELQEGATAGSLRLEEMVAALLDAALRSAAGPNLFLELDPAGALAAARASQTRLEHGRPRALEGVPVAVKANIDVAGLSTSCGTRARPGHVAAEDADTVARLRAAGAVVLGTLNMHEAALGGSSDNPWFGRVFNPHDRSRSAGGSSGASGAAVAAGLCLAALGTDTMGSVRVPAAYCGTFGIRPTLGAISTGGMPWRVPEFDTIGPLAATLEDLGKVLRVLGGGGRGRGVSRIVLLERLGGVACESAVTMAYERATERLLGAGLAKGVSHLRLDVGALTRAAFLKAVRSLKPQLAGADPAGLSEDIHYLLDLAAGEEPDEALLASAGAMLRDAIGENGALLMPTVPHAAFRLGEEVPPDQACFNVLASIAGLPALAIPAGVDANSLPVGIQLVGAAHNELSLIDLARRVGEVG